MRVLIQCVRPLVHLGLAFSLPWVVAACVLPLPFASADGAAPWWDAAIPRIVQSSDLQTAINYHANIGFNGACSDPGWGLWCTMASVPSGIAMRQSFGNAGIRSIGYTEAFGTSYTPIVEIAYGQPSAILSSYWSWLYYGGGPIRWAGVWTWFDDADFARPYTRTHPVYGGPPMTFPDGTVATGFTNDDPTDPRNSRVYQAAASRDIMGALGIEEYCYNEAVNAAGGPYDGLLYIPSSGMYSGMVQFAKDSACPLWREHDRACARMMAEKVGMHGAWCDNTSPWNSFMSLPTGFAFGEWSVALFRAYLRDHFTESQLRTWGVLGPSGTYADLASFDVRAFLRNIASSKYGWNGTSVSHSAWTNPAWVNEPVWRAYKIFKRQVGTQALSDYHDAVKSGAALGGNPEYVHLGNDVSLFSLGWLRGSLDMASTEFGLGWSLAAGSRGFGLPPFARLSPFYKCAREHAKSRFVNVWLYNDGGFEDELALDPVINAIYYEMLASHTMPMLSPGDPRYSGNPAADQAFFRFVRDEADPEFGRRTAVEDIGVYASTSSILSQYTPGGVLNFSSQPHHFAVWGWATALSELHYQFRILPEWKLSIEALRALKLLVIPDSEVFDPADVTVLDAWVRNDGGILIVTGGSGSRLGEGSNFDTSASLTLSPLTNVPNLNLAPATATKVVGNGRVRFIKSNIGLSYFLATASGRASQLSTFATELSTLLAAESEETALLSTNAPKTAGITLYEDAAAGKLFVDVNNLDVSIAGDGRSAAIRPTSEISVSIARRPWWNAIWNGALTVRAISPSGPVTLPTPVVTDAGIDIRIPPTSYYTSVILSPATPLNSAKARADGTGVLIDGQIVSAVFDDCFYIEQADRACGLRVDWAGTGVSKGQTVTVSGTMGTNADCERMLAASSVRALGSGNVAPLAMSTRALGGGDSPGQRGPDGGAGANNVGLLVTVSGAVTSVGSGYACVDDGGGLVDISGAPGVRVILGSLSIPHKGRFVTVTGISTLKLVGGRLCACVRPRSQSDIAVPARSAPIGLWDFEGENPLANKASGVSWAPLTLIGVGASVLDGKLSLPRYMSGAKYYQSRANTMLKTDLGPDGYFREMTQVAWVQCSGLGDHYGRLLCLSKLPTSSYAVTGTRAAQAMVWGGYSGEKWRGLRAWEYLSGGSLAVAGGYLDFGSAADPPADRTIKIAQVLRQSVTGSYDLAFYWDTGGGLSQVGTMLTVPESEVNAFGQFNTTCLVDPSGGKRYDGLGIMDVSYVVPSFPGSVIFEEIRLYGVALDELEIESLQPM